MRTASVIFAIFGLFILTGCYKNEKSAKTPILKGYSTSYKDSYCKTNQGHKHYCVLYNGDSVTYSDVYEAVGLKDNKTLLCSTLNKKLDFFADENCQLDD